MKFCSVHTHSILCDGKNTIAEMAQAAFAAGAVSFGASGHSHTQISWDEGCVLPADPAEYRAEVLRLREEYRGRMDVLLGIEPIIGLVPSTMFTTKRRAYITASIGTRTCWRTAAGRCTAEIIWPWWKATMRKWRG